MLIEVWADLQCPWCYIAHTRLGAAVADAGPVELRHRVFQLDPGLTGQVPVIDYLGRKYGGGPDNGRAMTERVTAVAAEDGLTLRFAHAVKTSTRDGHRLVLLAERVGGPTLAQLALKLLYAAHFEQSLALDDPQVLTRIGSDVGLAQADVADLLAGDDLAERVTGDHQRAVSLGVTGVPFTVADARLAVSGAQPVAVYTELIRQTAPAAAGG